MGRIDDDFAEWAKQNLRFPEDFIAETIRDEEPDEKDLKRRAKDIKVEITLEEFGMASARAIALFKAISEFAGIKFDIDPFVKVTSLIASELFDAEKEE